MQETNFSANGGRSLASLVAEIRDEIKEVVTTRVELFKSELRASLASLKAALPLALIAAVMLATAYLLLSLALVALIVVAFAGNPYRWFFALLIVGGIWLVIGGIAALFAVRRFQEHGFFPKKTAEVLRADKAWLQNELRGSV
jgi:uncharacterized membrane protein YqjE